MRCCADVRVGSLVPVYDRCLPRPELGEERKSISGGWRSAISQKEKSVLPEKAGHWSLATLREKLVKTGAKVVHQGRYLTFQQQIYDPGGPCRRAARPAQFAWYSHNPTRSDWLPSTSFAAEAKARRCHWRVRTKS